jgi:uncharacterized membrane protein YgdD (TMEM256/DUF423 family)
MKQRFARSRGFQFVQSIALVYDNAMTSANAFRIAAIFGFLGVAFGAFGAHTLKNVLTENGTSAIWEKATLYHLVHSVVLLLVASHIPFPALAWWLFTAGITIFSGSLYLLAITNVRWLGAITPLGGLSLLAGWLVLGFSTIPPSAAASGAE